MKLNFQGFELDFHSFPRRSSMDNNYKFFYPVFFYPPPILQPPPVYYPPTAYSPSHHLPSPSLPVLHLPSPSLPEIYLSNPPQLPPPSWGGGRKLEWARGWRWDMPCSKRRGINSAIFSQNLQYFTKIVEFSSKNEMDFGKNNRFQWQK